MKPIDKRRIEESLVLMDQGLSNDDRWYIHSILAQCFLPYRNSNTERWVRTNGQYGITVQSGVVPQPGTVEGIVAPGIPYGAKPRLINCYAQTYAIRQKTPVILIERSMSAFMRSLGFKVTGGKHGTISRFQDQAIRLAASKWTVWGPSQDGRGITQFNAEPYRRIDLWFPTNPNQETLWPSEVELTREFFESLLEHAIPYDYRALSLLRSHARAQDVPLVDSTVASNTEEEAARSRV
jgi:hypothetical protein